MNSTGPAISATDLSPDAATALAGWCLALETSTPRATVAVVQSDGSIRQRGFQSDRSHNSLLFAPLQELLGQPESRPHIRLVLVGSGPGSYSGTRVGIAAAQGVAIAENCPAVAVPSILAVAPVLAGHPCLVVGDARRGSFWSATIDDLRISSEPSLCTGTDLRNQIEAAFDQGRFVFSFEETGRFPLPEEWLTRVATETPDATGLWQAWSAADPETRRHWSDATPQPIYLAPPHITPSKRPFPHRGQQPG